jgi:hypothetical protein
MYPKKKTPWISPRGHQKVITTLYEQILGLSLLKGHWQKAKDCEMFIGQI